MPKWKPVVLDTAAIFDNLDGLVGIEVLDEDAETQVIKKLNNSKNKRVLVDGNRRNNKNIAGKKRTRDKAQEEIPENDSSDEDSTLKPHIVNNKNVVLEFAKKVKKRKNKIKQTTDKPVQEKTAKVDDVDSDKECSEDTNESYLKDMTEWVPFGLRKEILHALHDKGFLRPTPIQQKCVLAAMTSQKSDIVGAAETGSGKTYAYGIPIVQSILTDDNSPANKNEDTEISENLNDELRAVVVTPTRELAVQVKTHLADLCKYTDISVALVVGGLAKEKQERILKWRPKIVVGTPGRLWELFSEGNLHLNALPRVRMLVVDEADRMLEAQHFAELGEILQRMNDDEEFSNHRRNFVFSATLTFVHDLPSYHKDKNRKKKKNTKQKLVDLLARIGVKNKIVYDLTQSKLTPESLREWKINCAFEEKDYYLVHFLQANPGRAIIFCNSIGCVRRLANLLSILKFSPLPLHANMEQKQRLRNLEKFRDNFNGLLLATDVAARGLDIPQVSHVVHYQVPRTAESYIHRSGRSARSSSAGATLLLVSVEENKQYNRLMKSLKRATGVEDLDVAVGDLTKVTKLVHLARDLDQASLALKKTSSTEKWYDKAIRDMDILVDDDERPEKTTDRALNKMKKEVALKEKELNALLRTPQVAKGFSGLFPDVNLPKPPKRRKIA